MIIFCYIFSKKIIMEIMSLNIPKWLRKSDLARNLSNDDEGFIFEKQYYRKEPITSINNTEEWFNALKIYDYWGMDYPDFFAIYYFLNPTDINKRFVINDEELFSEDVINMFMKNIKTIISKLKDDYSEDLITISSGDFYNLSENHYDITLNSIEKHIDKPWDWNELSQRDDLTEEFLDRHISAPWKWNVLPVQNFSEEFIIKHIDKPWRWNDLSHRKLSESFLEKYFSRIRGWKYVFQNSDVSFEFITTKNDVSWFYHALSYNKNVPFSYIEEHIDENWQWKILSCRKDITIDIVRKYINRDWDWGQLSLHLNVTEEFLSEFINESWNWYLMSSNPNITDDIVIKYSDKDWSYFALANNSNITPKILYMYGLNMLKEHDKLKILIPIQNY